jgi:RIO kinase 2
MKLDTKALRYLSAEDWRVLTAVEAGSRNHEVVPTPLISQLSSIRGGVQRCISTLAKADLIAKVKNAKYDGYRLTYGGLDYLALHAHQKSDTIYSVGNQIGVGKESDIYVVANTKGEQLVLKIHRLGRISFRTVKNNRDYLRKRSSASWMYMSRLAAVKEFTFMKALSEAGVPVPEAIAQNRHQIVMSLIDGFPLRQVSSVPDPAGLYAELMELILRLARLGLVHGDFNEFNILIKEEEGKANESTLERKDGAIKLIPILIDFPQMVSIDHSNAQFYFDRDVDCIKRYFERRFHFVSSEPGPFFEEAKKLVNTDGAKRLDVAVEASGFSKKMAKELEVYMREHGVREDAGTGEQGAREPAAENEEEGAEEAEDSEEQAEEREIDDSHHIADNGAG